MAFSGGPDSTALLWALTACNGPAGWGTAGDVPTTPSPEPRHTPVSVGPTLEIVAVHVDHGLDPDSARRALRAEAMARRLGVPFVGRRLSPPSSRRFADGLEAWARRERYALLESLAAEVEGARAVIATAHHADDQAETVLLRMLYGTGLEGLAGIAPRRGRIVRPLLALRRHQLADALRQEGLEAIEDPTNRHLDRPRNRLRHELLPRLAADDPALRERAVALAAATARFRARLEPRIGRWIDLRADQDGASVDRAELRKLPEPVLDLALGALDRRAGRPYPTAAQSRRELRRQLRRTGPIGCDGGDGWRWQGDSRRLWLLAPRAAVGEFSYTIGVPGSVEIPQAGARFHLRPIPFDDAPDSSSSPATRVALAPDRPDSRVEIRNRRTGDRIQPSGRRRPLRLKTLLIDQGIPRHRRDRLPLLVIDDEIAWIPGLPVAEPFRPTRHRSTWIAELEPSTPTRSPAAPDGKKNDLA